MGRWVTNLVILVSLGVLAGVGWYFFSLYKETEGRQRTLMDLGVISNDAGPCAALMHATRLGTSFDAPMLQTIESMRSRFAGQIVGKDDRRSQRVLLDAAREGFVDLSQCEQIGLATAAGEAHPVLAFLRFTREDEDPCGDNTSLAQVLKGLSSHRGLLLHGLMKDVSRLDCLSPTLAQQVAGHSADYFFEIPQAFDDLDTLRVGGFLNRWSPLRTAQAACRAEVRGEVSRLANQVGCGSHALEHLLTQYKYAHPLPAKDQSPGLPAGGEVLLLDESGTRCEVLATTEPKALYTVTCKDLSLVSDVHVAVLVDRVEYGVVRADLVAGIATLEGAQNSLMIPGDTPPRRSWFGYSKRGLPLGTTEVVDLREVARELGSDVPESPLRAFCREAGARYCYDVDWAEVMGQLPGDAVIFLSRPLNVFPQILRAGAASFFADAFGREPREDAVSRVYRLGHDAYLAVESTPDTVDLKWQLGAGGSWEGQSFGRTEGGKIPPAARLLAALDVEHDGRPEILIQRATREDVGGVIRDSMDEIFMMKLSSGGDRFENINRLTIHEY